MVLDRVPKGSKYGLEEKYTEVDRLQASGDFAGALAALDGDDSAPALARKARWMGEWAKGNKDLDTDAQVAKIRESIEIAIQAVERDPEYAPGHRALAMCKGRIIDFLGTREKIQASKDLKDAIDKSLVIDPDESASWHVLAKWNVGLGKFGWMERTAIKLIYGQLPPASYEEAIRCFERAEECWSNSCNLYEMGQTYLLMGKKAEAKAAFEKAVAASDELPVYREAIANAREALAKNF